MSMIHLVLQGKGGVGKTYVSVILAQYLLAKGHRLACYDTDPVNATFSRFHALNVQHVNLIMDERINQAAFDPFFASLMTLEHDAVIDNGATSFDPLMRWLHDNKVIGHMQQAGRQMVLHTVIAGGNALQDSMTGFHDLAATFGGQCPLYVWRNECFGDLRLDGLDFESCAVYHEHKAVISGIIKMRRYNPDTYGKNIEAMLSRKLTFDEPLELADFIVWQKQRLQDVKHDFFEVLDMVLDRGPMRLEGETS